MGLLGASRAVFGGSQRRLAPSEAVLGACWGHFGALLERLWADLGLLGCLGAILEAFWAVWGDRKPI